MATQKQIQSAINVLKARLNQVQTSNQFTVEERIPLVAKIENRITILTNQLEVCESKEIQP
jgi:hypothetical protein